VSFGDYLVGLVFFAGTLIAVLAAAGLIVRRRLSHLDGVARLLAFFVLATGLEITVHLIAGAVGLLTRVTVLVVAAAALAIVTRLRPRPRALPAEDFPTAPGNAAGRATAALAVSAVGVTVLALLHQLATVHPTGVDALTFHLPGVARWIQSGSVWPINQFVPEQAQANYPQHGDVVMLAGVLPWRSDFLVRVWLVPFLAMTGVATYAMARELRSSRFVAALAGALVASLPTLMLDTLGQTLPDAVALSCFGAGIVFALRHWRTGMRADLVLAGIGLGIAFGTKWYAVSSVVAVVAVWAAASLWSRRASIRAVGRQLAMLGGVIGLSGGFWLVRNLVGSGNPVFPLKVGALGVTVFDAPRDLAREQAGFSLLDYAGHPAIWSDYFVPAWTRSLGAAAFALAGVVVIAGWLALRARRDVWSQRVLLVCAWAAVLAVVYAATPYTALGLRDRPVLAFANVRYALPAVMVAAALAGWMSTRNARLRPPIALALLIMTLDGVRRTLLSGPGHVRVGTGTLVVGLSVVLVATLAAAVVTPRLAPAIRRRGSRTSLAAAALAVLGIVAAGVAGRHVERVFDDAPYLGGDRVVAWLTTRTPAGHRVGLVGIWDVNGPAPVRPAFGPRLRNDVAYVGPFVRGLLRRYSTAEDLLAALRRGRYDLVVVGRGVPPRPEAREEPWLRRAGFREVSTSTRLALYRAPNA
jgi:hypothetical protein